MVWKWRFDLREVFGRYPSVFYATFGRKDHNRHLNIAPDTDLVIEGYPRSANTFAVVAFHQANPNIKVAHHLHVPAQIMRAAELRIPALVLIRKPQDAVASILMRNARLTPARAMRSYCDFYRTIAPYRDSYLVADFDDVIADFPAVITALNARFGRSWTLFRNGEDDIKQVFKLIDEMESDAMKSPNPKAVRETRKPEVLALVRGVNPALLAQAESLYASMRAFALPKPS